MKKILLSFLTLGIIAATNAQEVISFESSEGYTIGNVMGQNNWSTTGAGDGNIENQIITNDAASEGTYSLKIQQETAYGVQQGPIVGAFHTPTTPITWEDDMTISADMWFSQWNGSSTANFILGIVNLTEGLYDSYILFGSDGNINVLTFDSNNEIALIDTGADWTGEQWYNVKLKVNGTNIEYYINDTMIISTPTLNSFDVEQVRFSHNNGEGFAYIDNVKINAENLSVDEVALSSVTSVYPNPAKDMVNIKLSKDFDAAKTTVTLTSVTGKKAAQFVNVNEVNVSNLAAGVYVMTITDGKKVETKKLIKK